MSSPTIRAAISLWTVAWIASRRRHIRHIGLADDSLGGVQPDDERQRWVILYALPLCTSARAGCLSGIVSIRSRRRHVPVRKEPASEVGFVDDLICNVGLLSQGSGKMERSGVGTVPESKDELASESTLMIEARGDLNFLARACAEEMILGQARRAGTPCDDALPRTRGIRPPQQCARSGWMCTASSMRSRSLRMASSDRPAGFATRSSHWRFAGSLVPGDVVALEATTGADKIVSVLQAEGVRSRSPTRGSRPRSPRQRRRRTGSTLGRWRGSWCRGCLTRCGRRMSGCDAGGG